MAWRVRRITGGRRLTEDLALEATRIVEYEVDNPTNPERPFGPFTIELPHTLSEQQMRDRIEEDARKMTGLAIGG